jgi:hypothetical protein
MIRPSSLPKLALCPQFEGAKTTSPEADRGTRIDAIFRDGILGKPAPAGSDPDELEVARWAIYYVLDRCGMEDIFSSESLCKVGSVVEGLELGGTMDAQCPTMHLLFDIKTGEFRNYREQMAFYALACMDRYGASEWTAVLVFADQREIREHVFRRADAERLVREVVRSRTVGIPAPVVCDYCEWCAKFAACEAVTASANVALGLVPDADRFERAIATPDGLAAFLNGASIVDQWAEIAKAEAKKRIMAGESVPGWRIQSRSGSRRVDVQKLLAVQGTNPVKLFPKSVSEKTAREALPSLPDSLIERGEGTIALTKTNENK